MYKGVAELVRATKDTLDKDNLIPIYQQSTLQVMSITLGELVEYIKEHTAEKPKAKSSKAKPKANKQETKSEE